MEDAIRIRTQPLLLLLNMHSLLEKRAAGRVVFAGGGAALRLEHVVLLEAAGY